MSAAETATLPIVAIVGRPNVGKSTLWNRLSGTRKAIVEDFPGVTRDRLYGIVEAAGRRVLLVDTAGLDLDPSGELNDAVQQQAQVAVAEASATIFVVDGREGLLPVDEEIARVLRRSRGPVALFVNKIDVPSHESYLADFLRVGFERTWPVSAEHGGGVWDAFEALLHDLPEAEVGPPADAAAYRIALVGRPNVGKSSLLNRIVGEERVVVSAEGGTTRDAIDTRTVHEGEVYEWVDTAGLRKAARRDRVGEGISALFAVRAIERAEVVLVVMDAGQGVTDQDLHILGMARERGRAAALVANKWDLVEGEAAAKQIEDDLSRRLRFAADTPILRVSAKSGYRVGRLFALVRALTEATRTRVPTAELNRWLEGAVADHEPSMAQRGTRKHPLRFFYATQVAVSPPSLVLFCSDPRGVRASYRRYLVRRFRERFDVAGTPIRIVLRSRRKEE